MQAPSEHMDSQDLHDWRIFRSPYETWEAVYRDCVNARYSIEFEQYIFREDELGKRFLELFARKAAEGVKIRLLFDSLGSAGMYYFSRIRKLRKLGVEIGFYNPLSLLHVLMPWTVFPRTHSKTLLIDSHIVYNGGVCFDQTMEGWRDVQLRVTGAVAAEVEAYFRYIWQHPHGWRRYLPRLPIKVKRHENMSFRFAFTRPYLKYNPIYEEMRTEIRSAAQHVYIASPYFIPSRSFLRRLGRAAAQGADVCVMVSERTDSRIADRATESYILELLKRGIRVFLYQGTVYHGKMTVVDGNWATIGSMNLDYLSVFRNRETNLIITEPAAVRELAKQFEGDMQHCREIRPHSGFYLPFWQKAMGRACRMLRLFL